MGTLKRFMGQRISQKAGNNWQIIPPYLGMESGPQWLLGFSAYFIADIGLALLGGVFAWQYFSRKKTVAAV